MLHSLLVIHLLTCPRPSRCLAIFRMKFCTVASKFLSNRLHLFSSLTPTPSMVPNSGSSPSPQPCA
ncbi:CDK5 regulatory subunit associated protein 2, isoform CRA_a [Rattus norvegicus]|uniref:CDK5 regulatory subunit associated protein 2, isoform CRA_a n=1 Tax=Rattus norvegicus TaxID=10116 RepID=A6J806_RAT|nr:CDK5 regulatory subunit associated protein 2, isoform CRA_a [Rattus norvegicus]